MPLRQTFKAASGSVFAPLALAALLPLLLFGCLPSGSNRTATAEAPVVDTEIPDAETAYWRNEYRKNRGEPPREFQVRAKPAPNNQFGEFEDDLFLGLDNQPNLPDLPGDPRVLPMMGGGRPLPYSSSVALEDAGRPAAAGAGRPPGVTVDERFYPVEQLVYGGAHPDMDKPEAYRLMPKDVISVTVRDHPEFSGSLTIAADGTVRVPNTPDFIRLRGLTVDEAAEELRRGLAVYVRGDCVVRVQANRARGGYYFVFGDVRQPGRFPMGLEPVKVSDAVLAANWEAAPARAGYDDEELGPAFPMASPRGRMAAPRTADLARVMLITPHRSQPVRSVHDIRRAMLGMTADDPVIRPGQVIMIPSLDPSRNASLGVDLPPTGVPPAPLPEGGFSTAASPARLPEIPPPERKTRIVQPAVWGSTAEANMAAAFDVQANVEAMDVGSAYADGEECGEVCEPAEERVIEPVFSDVLPGDGRLDARAAPGRPLGRRLGRKLPEKQHFSTSGSRNLDDWNKGF